MTRAAKSKSNGERVLQLRPFWLAGRLFGVNVLDVKEIEDEIQIAPILDAPAAVRGQMNIRGQIHLVLDLRAAFGYERRELDRQSRVVLFKSSVDEPFGVLVDQVDEVVEVRRDQVEERRRIQVPPQDHADRRKTETQLTIGVCKLARGVLVVVDSRNILSALTGKPPSRGLEVRKAR
jgi:purine-binding chemotaxis protein CheW